MAQPIPFQKARADYHRAAAMCDRPWENYRKARERLAKQRGQFAAEQGFIEAGQAVARAADRLDEKEAILWKSCMAEASDHLRVGGHRPSLEEKKAYAENLLLCAKLSPQA